MTKPTNDAGTGTEATQPRRTRGAWRVLWVKIGWRALVAVLVVLGVAMATSSAWLKYAVRPAVAAALGCDVTIDRVRLTGAGALSCVGVRLRVPGMDGTAGTFFEAPQVELTPRWGALLMGGVPIDRVVVYKPLIRISQDQNMQFNVGGLVKPGGGGGPLRVVPSVVVHDALLNLGEHGPGWYEQLISIRVEGEITRLDAQGSSCRIELVEVASGAGPGSADAAQASGPSGEAPGRLRLTGELDLKTQTGELSLDNLDLSRWQSMPAPQRFQDWWRGMNLTGQIEGASLKLLPNAGRVISLTLNGVSMNLPVPAETSASEAGAKAPVAAGRAARLLAMRDVSGTVSLSTSSVAADLRGEIEDLPCKVDLKLSGPSLDGQLWCRIRTEEFELEKRPRLLPFAPKAVKLNLRRFSAPTAIVSGDVLIERDAPTADGPGRLRSRGSFDFRNGAARFEKFPYPFADMRGKFRFDEEKVEIVSVTGVGPTGAKLLASGTIRPPDDGAQVELDIVVVDVPTDEVLMASIPERRRPLVDMILSGDSLAESAPLAKAAGFELGGVATIRVRITRALGDDSKFETVVDVSFPRAGLVSRYFAYPVLAENLHLQINEGMIVVTAPTLRGLSGARASLYADAELGEGGSAMYQVQVDAADVPVDEWLQFALRAREGPGSPDAPEQERTVSEIVRMLGLDGTVDVTALVLADVGEDPVTRIGVQLDGVNARPGDGCLDIGPLAGRVDLNGRTLSTTGLEGVLGDAPFRAEVRADWGDEGADLRVQSTVKVDGFDVSLPVEALLREVAPEAATVVENRRAEWNPFGRVDAALEIESVAGDVQYGLDLTNFENASLWSAGRRVSLADVRGGMRFEDDRFGFSGFSASLLEGDPVRRTGVAALDGTWPLQEGTSGDLAIDVRGAHWESRFARFLAARMSPTLARTLEETDLAGVFDLMGQARNDGAASWFEGQLSPGSLAFTRGGRRVVMEQVRGSLRLDQSGGRLDGLGARGEGWDLSVDGGWTTTPTVEAQADVTLEALGLPEDLLAMMPADVRTVLDEADALFEGMVRTDRARVGYSEADGGRVSVAGAASFEGASMNVGLPVTLTDGTLELDGRFSPGGGAAPVFSAQLRAAGLETSGLEIDRALVVVGSGQDPGVIDVSRIQGDLHGGAISGNAALFAPSQGAGRAWSASLRLASADFAMVLADLADGAPTAGAPEQAPGEYRGLIDGAVTLEGITGTGGERRGRGMLRVSGGEVVSLPGVMPLLRLSNFQPPVGEQLREAEAHFYLRDQALVFESLWAASESVTLGGKGEIRLGDGALDLTFNSRGKGDIPLLSDLMRGVRDEIVTSRVTGTLREPEFSTQSLGATQRMLGTIFGGSRGRDQPPGAKAGEEAVATGADTESRPALNEGP